MIPPREYYENPKQKPYIINIEDNQVFSADYVFQMMFYLRKQIDRMWRKVLLLAGNCSNKTGLATSCPYFCCSAPHVSPISPLFLICFNMESVFRSKKIILGTP